jgi:hypothetical protein
MYTFAKLLLSELPPWLLHLISLCFCFLHYSSHFRAVLPILPVYPHSVACFISSFSSCHAVIPRTLVSDNFRTSYVFNEWYFVLKRILLWLPTTPSDHMSLTVEQSLSEPNYSSASQICCILWNPKVHYHAHNSLPPFPVWARWIQFTSCHHIYSWSILVVSFQL